MKRILNKYKLVISAIFIITVLFLIRNIYSDHNLKKIIGACILTQSKNSSIEEAKKNCAKKFK